MISKSAIATTAIAAPPFNGDPGQPEIHLFINVADGVGEPGAGLLLEVYATGQPEQGFTLRVADGIGQPEQPLELDVMVSSSPYVGLLLNTYNVHTETGEYWDAQVWLDDVDISASLIGRISVETEENSARIASFTIEPSPGTLYIQAYVRKSVKIDFILKDASGVIQQQDRIFTGIVDTPTYDPVARIVSFDCTDQFQESLDGMSKDDIDALIPAFYSPAVFDENREGFDYAQDRLSTIPKSLNKDRFGNWQLSSWDVGGLYETWTLPFDESIELEIANSRDLFNRLKLSFDYRYTRFKQRDVRFGWQGVSPCDFISGLGRFLPKDMAEGATNSTGIKLSVINFTKIPRSGLFFCYGSTTPQALVTSDFQNDYLCNGFNALGMNRYTQDIVERYTLEFQCAESIATFGEILVEEDLAVDADIDTTEWDESEDYVSPPPGIDDYGHFYEDREGNIVIDDVFDSILNQALVRFRAGHRKNRVSFDIPLSPQLELSHYGRLNTPNLQATGKVGAIFHEMDIDAGIHTTKVTLFVSATAGGVGTQDPMTKPAKPITVVPGSIFPAITISTIVGGLPTSPPVDGDGNFAPNITSSYYRFNIGTPLPGTNVFEAELAIEVPEIEEAATQERVAERSKTYSIAIPDDELTITIT